MTSFHGLLKILHNITHVINRLLKKKPLLVSFLHDKRDNSENRMYIVNKCALGGVLHMMQRVHLITTDNHYCIGIHEFNICDFLNSKLVTDKILTKRQYLVT